MLNYHLQKEKGKALYQNLYECLKQDIMAGRLEAGRRILSKREMAESHGISVRTVMNAYDQLLAEGYLISREKRGYFVAKIYEKNARMLKVLPQNAIYAAETPGYRKIPWIYEDLHLNWCSVGMDEEGICMEELRKSRASVIHVSPEHHYPLGIAMTEKRKQELLEWESEYPDRYILEDDYDCEFRYQSQMNSTLKSMDRHHRVIYMNTFGKTLAPGVRISYMVLPEKLMERCRESANKFANPVSSCEQYTMAKFLNNGYFERHLRRMKMYCKESGQQLISLLRASKKLPVVEITGGESGTHLLVKLDTDLTDIQIRWAAKQRGIGVSCLSQHCSFPEERYAKTLVMTYSNVDLDVLEEAVRRLEEIF